MISNTDADSRNRNSEAVRAKKLKARLGGDRSCAFCVVVCTRILPLFSATLYSRKITIGM